MTMTYVLRPVAMCSECGDDTHPPRPGDPGSTRCARCWQALVHPRCSACRAPVSEVHVLPRGADRATLERVGIHVDPTSWLVDDPADRWVHPACADAPTELQDTHRTLRHRLMQLASWRSERAAVAA
jgi:hypothetical protein